MLLFAHVGIALAAGILLDKSLIRSEPFSSCLIYQAKSPNKLGNYSAPDCPSGKRTSPLTSVKNRLDYRFLLIGSLLPDLIDKPIGDVFFYQTFQNGRIFAHTLCFTIFLAILGAYVYKRWKKPWFLILSFGSAIHLILDKMWLNPRTLLWPIYGWSFAKTDPVNFFEWLPEMFRALVTNASVYVPEIIGFGILAWFAAKFIRTGNVNAFIRNGLAS